MKQIIACCSVIFILGAFQFCTKDKTPTPPEPCDPNKVYYQNDILPLVSSSCAKSGCHDAATKADNLDLSTYDGLMSIVKPGRPNDSEIMKVVNETDPNEIMPRPPYPPLTSEQKNKISKWISDGAYNNFCVADTGSCVTGVVSYSADIVPAIANCLNCHSGSSPSGGIDLSSYSGVQTVGLNGKLYNAVAQNGQASAMPKPPAPKLPACDISKIKSWAEAGCPNN